MTTKTLAPNKVSLVIWQEPNRAINSVSLFILCLELFHSLSIHLVSKSSLSNMSVGIHLWLYSLLSYTGKVKILERTWFVFMDSSWVRKNLAILTKNASVVELSWRHFIYFPTHVSFVSFYIITQKLFSYLLATLECTRAHSYLYSMFSSQLQSSLCAACMHWKHSDVRGLCISLKPLICLVCRYILEKFYHTVVSHDEKNAIPE